MNNNIGSKEIENNNLFLTIDMTIQSIAEKYLEEACIDNKCTDGGNIVIMNPKTGDILAMATYPDYDLNNPRSYKNFEISQEEWNSMEGSVKSNAFSDKNPLLFF